MAITVRRAFTVSRHIGLLKFSNVVAKFLRDRAHISTIASWINETFLHITNRSPQQYQNTELAGRVYPASQREDVALVTLNEGIDAGLELNCANTQTLLCETKRQTQRYLPSLDREGFAQTRYVLIVAGNGLLRTGALDKMISTLHQQNADCVYGGEDESGEGVHRAPFLNPAFDLEMLCDTPYVGSLWLLTRDAYAKHQTRTTVPDEEPLSFIAAECAARGDTIALWPDIAFHRTQPRSSAYSASTKRKLTTYRKPIATPAKHVGIIIPTKDRIDLLAPCIESIFRLTKGIEFSVLVISNNSAETITIEWLQQAQQRWPNFEYLRADVPFNWSKLNNIGVQHLNTDTYVFLNNDTHVLHEDWLRRLADSAAQTNTGTVGALLFYPDGAIQHAGIVLGIGGFADHVYAGCQTHPEETHPFLSPFSPRPVLANTGACLAIRAATLETVGGFNEHLKICGDVDLCVRLHLLGYTNRYNPNVQLVHYESATRSKAPLTADEMSRLYPLIEPFLKDGDPFYHPGIDTRFRYPSAR